MKLKTRHDSQRCFPILPKYCRECEKNFVLEVGTTYVDNYGTRWYKCHECSNSHKLVKRW